MSAEDQEQTKQISRGSLPSVTSEIQNGNSKWKWNESVLQFIWGKLGFFPFIDLFATTINTQLRSFVSYRHDPNCVATNAFLINCEKGKFYAFSPLVCLSKTLQKFHQDKAKGIMIYPDWLSQPFYPRLIELS